MQARRSVPRPLLVIAVLVPALLAGAPADVASANDAAPIAALPADASPEPGISPTGPTTPAAEDDDSEGTPWTGIVVGGGLGLLAGIGLMVLSKRRENRG